MVAFLAGFVVGAITIIVLGLWSIANIDPLIWR